MLLSKRLISINGMAFSDPSGLSEKSTTSDIYTISCKCQNLNVIFKDPFMSGNPFIEEK